MSLRYLFAELLQVGSGVELRLRSQLLQTHVGSQGHRAGGQLQDADTGLDTRQDTEQTVGASCLRQAVSQEKAEPPEHLTCSSSSRSSSPAACGSLRAPLLSSVFRPTPSISFRSTDRRRVCTLLGAWPPDREPIRESISSRNRMQGAQARACRNS
ncbi:hypothetical protein EYF80_061722 [Liparis tanakae]|uniref:Uncharacterized protein n=1 Tax=Liparis tanakae TaxID=230148 RepID=A0A4Z2EHH8_9TELE|nr:hypothetical protein EYF80_061722 [Liparis tanakae]